MIDSVPLIQNPNDAQQINASIIAMKKASRELNEKIVKLNSLNSELDKKIALLDSGLNKEIEDRKEAINSLDVSSVGGSGKYISAISETDGKIRATVSDLTSVIESGNNQPATSGGVADAIQGVTSLPTDAVLHYSFDNVPDYPDGTAVYYRNKDFTSADNWAGGQNKFTYPNGIVTVENILTRYCYRNVNYQNCIIKTIVKTSVDTTLIIYGTQSGSSVTITTANVKANTPTEITAMANGAFITIGINGIPINSKFEILSIYVGNGSYSTPIIDNANGQNNATNNGGIAVKGVSGKGIRFLGNGVAFLNEDIGEKNKSFSCWFSIDNTVPAGCIFCKNYNGFIVQVRNINNVNTLGIFYYSAGWTNIRQITANTVYHLVVICGETNIKIYLNGVLVTTINVTVINNINRLYIGALAYNASDGLYGIVDDLLIFDRALTENEVTALYLNKANTPKYYSWADWKLNQIKNANRNIVAETRSIEEPPIEESGEEER